MKIFLQVVKVKPAVFSVWFDWERSLIDFSSANPNSSPRSFLDALLCMEQSSKGSSSSWIELDWKLLNDWGEIILSYEPSMSTSKSSGIPTKLY